MHCTWGLCFLFFQYFYNSETRQYLYWDAKFQTYLPAPSGEGETSTAQTDSQQQSTEKEAIGSTAASAPTSAPTEMASEKTGNLEKKKEVKEKKEKVNVAKKIQKDMEKWAKQLNQRKEPQPAKPIVSFAAASAAAEPSASSSAALSSDEKPVGSADTAFHILERTGVRAFVALVGLLSIG